jgi:hypothetical protein
MLMSNSQSGEAIITLPESGIHSVAISGGPAPGGCCTWDFVIDNLSFTPVP